MGVRQAPGEFALVENGAIDARLQELLQSLMARPQGQEVMVTDHGLRPDTVLLVDKFIGGGGRFTLLDHHRSSMGLAGHDWATIDESRSATGLLFDHLGRPERFADFVALVEDHDMWRHQDPRSAPLAALVGLLGHDRFLERFSRDAAVDFTAGEQLLLEREDARRERYLTRKLEQARIVIGPAGRMAVCYAEDYQSDLAELLMAELEVKVTAIVNAGKRTVSLRGRGVDVSQVAGRMGGGGHARAAAFSFKGSRLETGLDDFEAALDEFLIS